MELQSGLVGTAQVAVTKENTAARVGSGSLPVFATPALAAALERAACNALDGALEAGTTSVGTHLDLYHDAATPVGMTVTATARLTAVEGRKLTFALSAHDGAEQIAHGTHERFLVFSERFVQKANAKQK